MGSRINIVALRIPNIYLAGWICYYISFNSIFKGHKAGFRIRIRRIRMFLPCPDPDPDPSKKVRKWMNKSLFCRVGDVQCKQFHFFCSDFKHPLLRIIWNVKKTKKKIIFSFTPTPSPGYPQDPDPDPDPHEDFCPDPDPQKKMRIRNPGTNVGNKYIYYTCYIGNEEYALID